MANEQNSVPTLEEYELDLTISERNELIEKSLPLYIEAELLEEAEEQGIEIIDELLEETR